MEFTQKLHKRALASNDELLASAYQDIILFIISTPMPVSEDEIDWNIDDWDDVLDKMNEQKADEQINLIKSIN